MTVTISVNGESKRVDEGFTVTRLLKDLEIPGERVAVEVNLQIVGKENYSRSILKEGDRIEIIRFVGGG